jgi:hypothetical protein
MPLTSVFIPTNILADFFTQPHHVFIAVIAKLALKITSGEKNNVINTIITYICKINIMERMY